MNRAWTPALILLLGCPTTPPDDDVWRPDDDDAADDDDSAPDDDDTGADDDDSAPDDDDTVADDDDAVPGVAFEVLTMNLQTPLLAGDHEARLQLVADVITAEQPDFVALQEATESLITDNTAEQLAGLVGYGWSWVEASDLGLAEGPGLISPWPILDFESAELPGGFFSRRVIGARLDTDAGEIPVFATHMTIDEDPSVKAQQALAIMAFIEDRRGDLPGFLAGDMNAVPEEPAMQVLRGEVVMTGETGDYLDGWLLVHPDDPGPTFPADDPADRIDYVFGIPDDAASLAPTACEHVLTNAVGGLWASDHVGVLCSFEWTP